jgi:phage replication O-like protein O
MHIIAPNYTQIPNVIFDYWMHELTHTEFKVLMVICRKTFGWHKDEDPISKTQIVKLTGASKRAVDNAIENLKKNNLIEIIKTKTSFGDSDANRYKILVNEIMFGSATIAPRSANEGGVVQPLHHGGSATIAPTKERLNTKEKKERKEKEIAIAPVSPQASQLFDFLFQEFIKKDSGKQVPTGDKKLQWHKVFDSLAKNRSIDQVKNVLTYALKHEYYITKLINPKKLNESFDEISQASSIKKQSKQTGYIENLEYSIKRVSELSTVCKMKNISFVCLRNNVEICHKGGNNQPFVLEYTSRGFVEQLENCLRKFEIT